MSKPSRVRRSRAACWLAATASLWTLGACVGDDVTVATDDEAIIGGTETLARPEIGRLFLDGGGVCTGTLVGPRHVLTAAHCIDSPGTYSFQITDLLGNATMHPVSAIHPFTGNTYAKALSGHTVDVALLTLTAPVTNPRPAAISTVYPVEPERVTLVGYGCTDRDTRGGERVKRYKTVEWGEPSEALCFGDSGGPALLGEISGQGPVWGVHHAFDRSSNDDLFADAVALRQQVELLMSSSSGIQTGFIRDGHDTAVVTRDSADACRRTCIGNTGCRAYVFDHRDRSCHIKDAAYEAVPSADFSTGLPPIQEIGYDRPGGDLTTVRIASGLAEECAVACADNDECRAYTFNTTDNVCYLKSAVTLAVQRASTVSGLIDRHRERNYDRSGHDLRTLTSIPDGATCARRCAGEAKCSSYTYQASDRRCWLKTGTPRPGQVTGVESGVKRGLEMGSDRFGGDYRNFTTGVGQPEVCQAACANDARCKAWTFRRSSGEDGSATCFLKNQVTERTPQSDMISGVKGLEMYR